VAGLGLAVRLLLSPREIFWGPFFGINRLIEAWGAYEPVALYGGGYSAIMAPISALSGHDPRAVFFTNLALAAAAPPLIWALARMLGGRRAALAAGLALALLPAHVRLSATEVMHIAVLTLELISVAAAVGFTRVGGGALAVTSALAIGLAVHVRPEVAPMALLPAGWVLLHLQRRLVPWVVLAAAIIAGMLGARALALREVTSAPASYGALLSWDFWWAVLSPHVGPAGDERFTHAFVQLRLTPPLLPALAAAGVALAPRQPVIFLGLWWALAALPVLPKSWPLADALRLQLPAQAPLLLLAGLGAAAIAHRARAARGGRPGLIITALIALGALPYLPGRTWAGHQEWHLLQESLARVPDGATVLYDDGCLHHEPFGAWLDALSPDHAWVGMQAHRRDGGAEGPLMAWLGVTCQYRLPEGDEGHRDPPGTACGALREACALRPVHTMIPTQETDVDVRLPDPPDPIGLYAVEGCR